MRHEQQPRGIGSAVVDHLRLPLFRNGYALVLNSGTSAVLGMLFWMLATRTFSPETVGLNAALVSAMTLLSTIAQLNLGNVLSRFLPVAGRRALRLVVKSYAVCTGVALTAGMLFLVGLSRWSPSLAFLTEDLRLAGWFLFSLVLWCLFVVQDGALSGIRRSDGVLVKNLVHSVCKVLLLLVPVVAASTQGVFLAWTLPLLPVLLVVHGAMVRTLRTAGTPAEPSQSLPPTRGVVRYAAADYVVALAGTGLVSLLPLLVLELSGAAAAAYFTLAWSVSYALYLVSRSMSTSLLVEAAMDTSRLAEYSYRTVLHTTVILLPAVAGVVLLAPVLLGLFGAEYADRGTALLRLLALSTLPSTIVVVYAAVTRVRRRMRQLVTVTLVVNAVALVAVWVMLRTYGLVGVGWAWLLTQSVAAAALLLAVFLPLWLRAPEIPAVSLMVRLGAVARSRIHRVRLSRAVHRTFPAAAEALDLPPDWSVQRVLTTVGDVSVAAVGRTTSSAVMKSARSLQGSVALSRSMAAVEEMTADPRLATWSDLLPRVLRTGRTPEGRLVVLEQLLDGIDGRKVLGSPAGEHAAATVLASISELHRRTATSRVVDDDLIAVWLERPAELLTGALGGAHAAGLRALTAGLATELYGRPVTVSRVHGDLAPGNVLLSGDGVRMYGIVDWERSIEYGLPEVDRLHFLLTLRSQQDGRELGDLVRGQLDDHPDAGWTRTLTLLTWLHHVSGIVEKTGRYGGRGVWAARNVAPVLARLRSLSWQR